MKKYESLNAAAEYLDNALEALEDAVRHCRGEICEQLGNVMWLVLEARIRISILRNRLNKKVIGRTPRYH